MKKLLFFLFSLISFISYAQLDTEHWFAPMMDRSLQTSPYQSVYMSTNETTPFKVDIYSNNILIGSSTISKGNPQKFSVPRNHIITTAPGNLFKAVGMGIYLKGARPFFASLRFSVNQHAEIVTSKGTAGIGTTFYTSPAPIQAYLNNVYFMTSILATDNNTNITINNFDPTVIFSDNVNRTSFNITLQKGQSYIIEGSSNFSQNWKGFIGAKITSDKPITITNGNFNGQYVPTTASSTDILMDQSVPIEKLGKEFVLVKGNGKVYQKTDFNQSQNMERAFIVAAVNGTNIYVNNSTTPANPAPLNAGDSFVLESENYINQGNQQYNMYIKSTENVYVFQLLAGASSGNEIATGGYNYIPPLSCYLPKTIDEIGFINENEGYKGGIHEFTSPTKLNIITEAGATVTVQKNGTNFPLTAVDGPYPVLGTNNWVTYSIARSNTTGPDSVSGNMSITSTKAVTAGISAGDGAVGYGGYFAGFSALPSAVRTGSECLSEGDAFLELTPGFDSYQWYERDLAGNPIIIPGATSNIYHVLHPGTYFAKLTQGSCAPIQTADKKFFNCDTYTNIDYKSCGSATITPSFTLSSQAVDLTTVKLVTPPLQGTIPTNPDGTIILDVNGKFTYTANSNASGIDKFKYSFKGFGTIPDTEEAQITVIMIEKHDAVLQECSTDGTANYNLPLADVSSDTDITKTYFKTQNGAENDIAADQISSFTSYTSSDGFIYVRIKNSLGCIAVAKVELKAKLAPEVKETLYTKLHCDEDIDQKIDGVYKVDLTTVTPVVLVQASNFVVKYYDTPAKANAGLNNNITGIFSFTADTKVWIRVDAPNGCAPVIKEIQLKTGTKFTVNDPVTDYKCDNDLNNSEVIYLSNYTSLFTTDPAAALPRFYTTLADAQKNTPTTSDQQTITSSRSFYYRFSKPGFCDAIGTLNISLKPSTPTALLDSYTVCQGASITLEAETAPVYKKWEWKQGANVLSTTHKATLSAGVYTVSFTDLSDCVFTKNITVKNSPKPIINTALYTVTPCDSNFDGESDPINFNTMITPIIITNFAANPGLFNVRYYLNKSDRDAGNNNNISNVTNWTFSVPTTVYVRAESQYCPYIADVSHEIHFNFGTPLPLTENPVTRPVCDSDLSNSEDINLNDYKTGFTIASGVSVKYFDNLIKAQNNIINEDIGANQTISGNKTYYLRFTKNGFCDAIGTLNIVFKQPKKSTGLHDKQICPGTTTNLDAGAGFDNYLWSNGKKDHEITDVPVGNYWVDLTFNGCVYRQHVSVTAVSLPEIISVDIKGSTVTVNVSGGNPPYQYALDGGNYQASNVFTNVPGGDHTVYVISADNCAPVSAEINVIQLFNAITPNGDGINDVLDYSGLLKKNEPFMQIFDRYGKTVFVGDQNNRFTWDGKSSGKTIETGSYWYVMHWKEPGFETVSKYNGWVLVKNRE